MAISTATKIEQALRCAFEPVHFSLVDESERHRGHAGAQGGGGHFRVTVVSALFDSKSRLERHRAVYEALETMMGGAIHALSIEALCPEEWNG